MNSSSLTSNGTPPFPEPGSILSSKYFCLGRLGRGTFCSIHQCVDLSYYHNCNNNGERCKDDKSSNNFDSRQSNNQHKRKRKSRLVAAKVELTQFSKSGVVDGEATILSHLSTNLPVDSVPIYHDHVRKGGMSAIIMEYLPGEDMHQLRERHCTLLSQLHHQQLQQQQQNPSSNNNATNPQISSTKCRVNLQDAVYLTADCMLPLLRQMHDAGIVHRDVKPNNCVRTGTTVDDQHFKVVDFGLSKSLVVPSTSSLADLNQPWTPSLPWHNANPCDHYNNHSSSDALDKKEQNHNHQKMYPCLRKERAVADFRGTSMYASLRVHQSRDYGRRDDIWGLLYVFCDLVSGGLPWMKQAGERDREMCKKMKEYVHGETNQSNSNNSMDHHINTHDDNIADLLKGAAHHQGLQRNKIDGKSFIPLPLALSQDMKRVTYLRKAFQHVSKLSFHEKPNYDLIDECLRGFLPSPMDSPEIQDEDSRLPPIDWNMPISRNSSKFKKESSISSSPNNNLDPSFSQHVLDIVDRLWPNTDTESSQSYASDPITQSLLEESEKQRILYLSTSAPQMSSSSTLSSSSFSPDCIGIPLSLQFKLVQVEYNSRHPDTIPKPLALEHWLNLGLSIIFEKWSMKYEKGKRRENDGYRREEYIKLIRRCIDASTPFDKFQKREYFNFDYSTLSTEENARKRRKRLSTVSVVWLGLRGALEKEEEKKFAPPPAISFSGPVISAS